MSDPLSEIITLLRPRAVFSKPITGTGRWAVRYTRFGHPSFAAVLEGRCRLTLDGQPPTTLCAGDFLLLPATPAFTIGGFEPVKPVRVDAHAAAAANLEAHHGARTGLPDVRMLGGYFQFDSTDAGLLVSLLPAVLHLRGAERLSQLVRMVAEESRGSSAGRDLVLTRLVEILLIEALRSAPADDAPPGLLRGLADPQLARAIRQMHAQIDRAWTIPVLAKAAVMSRSSFFDRFTRRVGMPPMAYLLGWRMTVAKNLLRQAGVSVKQVADRVGYGSASTFSTAFARHVGTPPSRFMLI